jgi:A-factor biosynthesis hotdog domain
MTAQMMSLDRRTDRRNAVLIAEKNDEFHQAMLQVDQTHTFYFDHPLDHVPGLLLLEGSVQLAQRLASAPCFVSSVEARFIKYVLFDAPIHLQADRGGGGGIRVRVEQAGLLRAEIVIRLSDCLVLPLAPAHQIHAAKGPCDGAPLGKWRAENVLIATPEETDGSITAQLLPIQADCLLTDSADVLHPLHLLEGFMQVQRYLNSQSATTARMRDILLGVSIRQTAPIPRGTAPLQIRGMIGFTETTTKHFSRQAVIACGDQIFAHCAIHTAQIGKAIKTG